MGLILSFGVEGSEAIFVVNILNGFYQEALKEIEFYKTQKNEDARDDLECWMNRADKYKKMIDELEKYIEVEANQVWHFVKENFKPKTKHPRKSRLTYTVLPCSWCGSTDTRGFGHRKSKYGSTPIRICRTCGKIYTNRADGLFKMKFPKEIIDHAVKLIGDGLSLRDSADMIRRTYNVKVSATSIMNWSRRDKKLDPGYRRDITQATVRTVI